MSCARQARASQQAAGLLQFEMRIQAVVAAGNNPGIAVWITASETGSFSIVRLP
jgi:hypothetical protein